MGDDTTGEKQNQARLIIPDFLSLQECKELEFIHRSCSTVGYRPNVFSTTLSHLIATNSPHLIIPFLSIRDRLKEKVEEFFGCEYELSVEFTGLISWTRGASIGWHTDDNRPYLKQRHFTAVCYLNTYGQDFKGGLFHFRDGHPNTLVPAAGAVSIYTADDRNVHSVDEIIEGERLTLTMWFSRDSAHDEDAKLISLLSSNMPCSSSKSEELLLPRPASSNMYWFCRGQEQNEESGFNICCARIYGAGFDIYSTEEQLSCSDFSELLERPLQLARSKVLFEQEFTNILHALQVVQFLWWKAPAQVNSLRVAKRREVWLLSELQQGKIASLKFMFVKDNELANKMFRDDRCYLYEFDWTEFTVAVDELEHYSRRLQKELVMSLPHWRTQQIIYKVPL
ncbi:unnamed protein product [Linum tenue]|uniref:procollagen-proline 3-dioxygenase n=1 Tax=Linum tenue TaxID=586396 RepID=A0AAV0R5U2_9ROSI|nr:unnamed protein product [Linum tenue]CAI0553046.1 unnamed protein product [Linum tenue]